MNQPPTPEVPIACDLTALSAEQQALQVSQAHLLFTQVAQETQELADGYAFRFAADNYRLVTDFIANERLCCQFFTFVLEVPPAQDPLWLRITGRDGVKGFLQSNLVQAPVSTHEPKGAFEDETI